MLLFWADINDPGEDPAQLLFYSAQMGSIHGMEVALERDTEVLYKSDIYERGTALHHAAASPHATVDAVKWLLRKGIPWNSYDLDEHFPEDLAQDEEKRRFLREWALQTEYELHYKLTRGEPNPDDGKPVSMYRMDKEHENELFCKSYVLYMNPNDAPEDEVALVCDPDGTGIMMEWERPIMCESARLLLDGMPKSGLRILNIGFGIGMIDTYFQNAQPAEHVIIEGHPTCLKWMRREGWYDRPGVRVLEGRWQDFFPPLNQSSTDTTAADKQVPPPSPSSEEKKSNLSPARTSTTLFDIGKFDVVYFDTFHEGYRGHFAFIRHVPRLLRGPSSRFSYFNGHASGHETQYKIYAEVARLHHNDLGMNTQWHEVDVDKETIWYNISKRGKKRENVQEYPHLVPICALAPTVPRVIVKGVGWNNNGGCYAGTGVQRGEGGDGVENVG